MSHEFSDNIKANHQPEENNSGEALFLKIHEVEKALTPSYEEIAKRVEASEKAIQEAFESVAKLAMRAMSLQGCSEPEHFNVLKAAAARGAAAGEPAYEAFHKALN